MANVYAVKSGNWSDPTVWNTGALPTTADNVYSNNFAVTVDGSFTVLTVANTAQSPAVAGGTFSLANGVTLTATATTFGTGAGFWSGSTAGVVTFNLAAGNSATIVGAVQVSGASSTRAIIHSGGGTLNIVGSVLGPNSNGTNAATIEVSFTGTLNITGDIVPNTTVSTGSGSSITISGAGTVNITGTLTASPVRPSVTSTVGCTVNVTGNVNAANATSITMSGASTLTVIGTLTASATQPAVSSTSASATNILSGPFVSNNGMMAFYGPRLLLRNTPSTYWTFTTQDLLVNRTMYTSDYPGDPPAVGNVRSGTTFGAGLALTGTMIVPPAASVGFGVPVDATTGTAASSPADIWNYATSAATTAGSMGERLKNCATVETTGDQWAAG